MFYEKLKELRKSKNVLQKDLATYLGVTDVTYSRYEKGVRQPDFDTLTKLAEYFNVTTDYLLGNESSFIPVQITDDVYSFPIRLMGNGSCGLGCNNIDYVAMDTFDIPSSWIVGDYEDYFLANAIGDSMEDAHIIDKSLVLFKRQEQLENGQIGAFSFNGEEYIKRFRKKGSVVLLESANVEYESIIVTEDDDFRMIGILKKIIINI